MTDQPTTHVPEDFLEQVKQVLENLYDFPYLQKHPLTQTIKDLKHGETPAQALRREIISAIETMNPGGEFFFRSPHARLYNLLHLHYVEGMTIQECSNELGISSRQAYRDLKRGQESIAEMLWTERDEEQEPPQVETVSSIQSEVARLKPNFQPTPVEGLITSALKSIERLAAQQQVEIESHLPSLLLSTDTGIAQQVLVHTLSHALKQTQPGTHLTVSADEKGIQIRYQRNSHTSEFLNPAVQQLAARLRWKLDRHISPDSICTVIIGIAAANPTVLIVDDNEGLVELLDRYLTSHAYHVIVAKSGQDGLHLAQTTLPDAIVLDVMMPGMDGWEMLQRLKAASQTTDIPVIICSVFNDPELASSLGASLFVAKPVSKDDILNALQRLGIE